MAFLWRLKVNRKRRLRRPVVLLPHLNCLISFARHQPRPRHIKPHRKNPGLRIQRPRLYLRQLSLKTIPWPPVPPTQHPVIVPRRNHVVLIHCDTIHHHPLAFQAPVRQKIMQKRPLRKPVLFQIIGRRANERSLRWVHCQPPNWLFMVGQRFDRLARAQVPQLYLVVMRAGDDLRLVALHHDRRHRSLVPR